MTSTARAWLPEGAALLPPVQEGLRAVIADWSARWFSRREIRPSRFVEGRAGRLAGDRDWRLSEGRARFAYSEENGLRMAELALNAPADAPMRTLMDGRLSEALLQRMLEDLRRALMPLLAEGDAAGAVNGPTLDISLCDRSGPELMWISLPLQDLAGWIRTRLPKGRRAAALTPLAEILAAERLRLEARLGCATIAFGDLATLAPGDVVILDHLLDDPIQLGLPAAGPALAYARLTEFQGDRALVLTASPP